MRKHKHLKLNAIVSVFFFVSLGALYLSAHAQNNPKILYSSLTQDYTLINSPQLTRLPKLIGPQVKAQVLMRSRLDKTQETQTYAVEEKSCVAQSLITLVRLGPQNEIIDLYATHIGTQDPGKFGSIATGICSAYKNTDLSYKE